VKDRSLVTEQHVRTHTLLKFRIAFVSLFVLVLFCFATVASAQGPFAYVAISSDNTVSVYDLSTNLLVASIPVGASPFVPAVTPSGAFVYVANFFGASVSVIDTATETVVATIPVGSFPKGIAITPDSSTVYVAVPGTNVVSVISTATQSVIANVPVGMNPGFLAVTPDGKFVYDANADSVSVISTATNTVTASISIGLALQFIAISPDGKTAYVTDSSSNSVFVIDIASNTVSGTIAVSNQPEGISISPDGTTAFVVENSVGAEAVVNLASNTVIATVPVGSNPRGSAVTPDGAFLWQTNLNSTFISVISTVNDTVTDFPVGGSSSGLAIAAAPVTSQSITQPLSPTAPNQFSFASHNFTVQYPAGTSFSGVDMTVVAAQASQATFKQRVAGTAFANATCIVYTGAGGNCVDYHVSCSASMGGAISCPSTATPSISVKTSFDTQQQIINPAFLTTPIGTNAWSNIFDSFSLQRIDPTVKGRTKGFSEFVAAELGATNSQGAATFQFLWPLRQEDARVFRAGSVIPALFRLTSIANPKKPVTDAKANISLQMVADAEGNATSDSIVEEGCEIGHFGGIYFFFLNTKHFESGKYVLTVYGNAFSAQQVEFTITQQTRHE
jgi:YVTN family beta-propeller protein